MSSSAPGLPLVWGPVAPTFEERKGLFEVDTCLTSSAPLEAAAAEAPAAAAPAAPLLGEPDELYG